MKRKIAALIYGNNLHYLDHLAPLCFFLNLPLITNDKSIFDLCERYYPSVNTIFIDDLKIHNHIVHNFDYIITCLTKALFDKDFGLQQILLNKAVKIIWTPHGFSDKGNTCQFFESLKNADTIFIYGKKMIEVLKKKKILDSISNYYEIGNYRALYYQKFILFYKKIVQENIISKLPKNNLNILYAPTWRDAERSSSFWNYFEQLYKQLPQNYNLIVKMHPNLIKENEIKIFHLKEKNIKKNILFIDDLTIIYPLLDFVDIYLGDFSSIGYDFLYFRKPMFFLPPENKKLYSSLYECGKLINTKNVFKSIDLNLNNEAKIKSNQEKLYKQAFSENANLKNILKKLQRLN